MARVELGSQAWGWLTDSNGNPQGNTSATLKNLDGTNATTWSAITGGSSSTAALTSNSDGTLPRYVDNGAYTLTVGAVTRRVDAVSGSAGIGSVGGRVSVLAHSADKTGATDNSTEFAAAWAAAGNGTVYAPEGTYRMTAAAFVGSGPLVLEGDGPGRTVINLENVNLAQITGTVGSAVLLTASVALGATTLTMTSTTGLVAGDYLILRDTAQVLSGTTASPYTGVVGEVVRIKTVDSGTVVTVWGAVEQAMTLTAGNLSVRKMNLVDGVTVRNCTIRNPNPATYLGADARGLQFTYCRNVKVENVDFVQLDDDGVNLDSCVDWQVTACNFYDLQNGGSRTPYGVIAANASVNGLVRGCRQTFGRHLFTTGGDNGEIGPAHVTVSDCQAWHSTTNPFDTHPAGRHVVFADCTAHSNTGGGFHLRSPRSRVQGCYVLGTAAAAGITIGGSATGSTVCDSEIRGVTTGVDVQAEDCDVARMKIEGSAYGVRVRGTVDLGATAITKARVKDIDVIGNPSVGGLVFNGTDTATRVRERIFAPDATTAVSPGYPSVTAAATLVIPIGSPIVAVAGNTGITSITATGHAGRAVVLKFEGTPTVTDGSNLKLAGNFVAAGTTNDNDTLTLACDGTNWFEVARSTN